MYNAGTGVLTLTGTDTLANYQAALRSVTYSSTRDDPTATSASRTIDWQVTDANSDGAGAQSSAVVTSTVNLTAVADAPVITAGATTGYTENAAAVVIDNTITVNDADDTQIAGATVTISAGLTAGDVLGFVNTASISGVYNAGTGVLTLSGTDTLANYQAALRSVTYSSTSEDPTATSASRTIDWQVTDANSDGAGAPEQRRGDQHREPHRPGRCAGAHRRRHHRLHRERRGGGDRQHDHAQATSTTPRSPGRR